MPASESIEEGIQEGISIQAKRVAATGDKTSALDLLVRAFDFNSYSEEDMERIRSAAKAGGMLSLLGGGFKTANTIFDTIQNKQLEKNSGAIEGFRYLTTSDAQAFDDLSPAAQKLVRKEFAGRPEELQKFIAQKSPNGDLSKTAQTAIDAGVDVAMGKSESRVKDKRFEHARGIFDERIGTPDNLATQSDIDDYVDYAFKYSAHAKEGDLLAKQIDRISILKVSKEDADYIKSVSGLDISDMTHALRDNDIRHLKNSHGEGTKEKYPISAEDIKKIPEIILTHDDILYVENIPRKKGVVYVKRHNGTTYYLEAIRDDEGILVNKQMIKVPTGTLPDIKGIKEAVQKKWGFGSSPNDSKKTIPRVYVQDVWNESSSEDSLTRKTLKVNTESSPKSDIDTIADDLPMRHIDGSVRTYREYAAEQEAKKQDAPPPADTEPPTANPDVEAAVNAPGVKRAEVIDLSAENALLDRLKGLRGAKKYKAVKDYILGALGDTIIFNDGIKAKVDKSDALHLAHKAGHVKVSYFSKIREIIDSAMLFLTDDNVTHNKFDAFRYYKTVVRLGEDEYPIYLNVGHAKNGDGYHLYDITKNVGEVEKQTSVFERVNDLRSKNDLPTLKSVPQPETIVKSEDASNSIVSDSMKPAEKFVSDKTWLQKKTDKLYKPDDAEVNLIIADPDIPAANAFTDAEAQSFSGEKYYVGHSYSQAFDRYAKNNLSLREALLRKAEIPVSLAQMLHSKNVRKKAGEFLEVITRLGIKKGSKESAAAQWYGEGFFEDIYGERHPYTESDLRHDFPDTWENIVSLSNYCRAQYDEYIDRLNAMFKKIYPHVEKRMANLDKRIEELHEKIANLETLYESTKMYDVEVDLMFAFGK